MTRERTHLLLAGTFTLLILFILGWIIIPKLNRGSLVMEAQIARPSGEAQPVAGATFYLLDADMIVLAMAKGNDSSPLRDRVYG